MDITNDMYETCKKCNGTGEICKQEEHGNDLITVCYICQNCDGLGLVSWTRNIIRKKTNHWRICKITNGA